MTREEAKGNLIHAIRWNDIPKKEALEMAVKALEQEPCPNAISRSDMLDAVGHGTTYTSEELQKIIKALPSVNPQPNKEDIHREREQAYMLGYEDGSRKYRTEQCEDAISRQAVLDEAFEVDTKEYGRIEVVGVDAINSLPPVNPLAKDYNTIYYTPQPKTGHWIFDEILDMHYYCSECKSMGVDYWDYCPNCGTKMIEPQESEGEE